ncbi:uncharacterized protein SCHCODRAFT_0113996 [Schizophyllum commune H4-8]
MRWLLNGSLGIIYSSLDVPQVHQYIADPPNVSAIGYPNARRPAPTDATTGNVDAAQEHQCRCHARASMLMLLVTQYPRDEDIDARASSPNVTEIGKLNNLSNIATPPGRRASRPSRQVAMFEEKLPRPTKGKQVAAAQVIAPSPSRCVDLKIEERDRMTPPNTA